MGDRGRASGRFAAILCSTDSDEIAEVARSYGAEVVSAPPEMAGATSPDIDWVRHALEGSAYDVFSILRPTSPFRRGATIERAWERFGEPATRCAPCALCASIRARCGCATAITSGRCCHKPGRSPHSRRTASLPEVLVQDSSLEIAWTRIVADGEIAGERVVPFFPEGEERHVDRLSR